jgi:hypothetical protein
MAGYCTQIADAVLPGVGYWTEQEAPNEVNRMMRDFLVNVDGTDAAN